MVKRVIIARRQYFPLAFLLLNSILLLNSGKDRSARCGKEQKKNTKSRLIYRYPDIFLCYVEQNVVWFLYFNIFTFFFRAMNCWS